MAVPKATTCGSITIWGGFQRLAGPAPVVSRSHSGRMARLSELF